MHRKGFFSMNILWVASEAVPFAKTGGLADVSGALPEAFAARGHHVSVFLPWYPQQTGKLNLQFTETVAPFGIPMGNHTQWATLRILKKNENLTYYFLEFNQYYDRPRLYDWNGKEYADNADRFIFLSRAAMETAVQLNLNPDILHANDWHSALCCVYLRSSLYAQQQAFANCKSVLTIHNIGYQGIFPKEKLNLTGLGWDYFNYTCLEYYDSLNFLKAGIMTADMVNAVSPSYASEILSSEYAFTLENALRTRAGQRCLRGILNGIDDKAWDPATDSLLPAVYSKDSMTGKDICREELQKFFRLPVRKDVPLFGTISRLAYQKGLDVFAASLEDMLIHDDFQFIVIGSGESYLENWFRYLAEKYPDKMAVYLGYASDKISHLLEAGADFFVMPSRYEPCGLNQMYSMRCGTLPIVRHTGGLADTVTNYNYSNGDTASGFVFWDLYPQALANTIRWAAEVRRTSPDVFRQMRRNAMSADFSWNRTASEYEQMYRDAHTK